ncbi:Histidine ammonia-lyase [Phycisphaerae bacterium RAS2]|nr:Histidine ammonia-lyase [Phycisphaerae bacterium RAS2]
MTSSHALTLDGSPIPFNSLDAALGQPLHVTLAAKATAALSASRDQIDKLIASGATIYGVNTGFGKLCNIRIPHDQLAALQENLLISHAVGVGPPMPDDIVRLMLLFKINALIRGASGVQPACVECLVNMLNADLLPVVPTRGSLGASGDLAPLAHLVLPLIGRGQIRSNGHVLPADQAFAAHGIAPVKLAAKDGLALINGTQFMLAYAAAIAIRAARLARTADIVASMSLEALRGSARPFDDRLMQLRPHPGAAETASNMRKLLARSEILPSHANCDKVQDPYSLRCIPQVHGACRDALRHATEVFEREAGSVTDNPVLVDGEVISGGLFHGEPLAMTLDYLAIALSEWANISERRTYLLLSGHDGLPPLLLKDTGINSGLMIPQYTAAALVNECKLLAAPASTDSIPTSLGQEDHVSMGANSALKCRQSIENAETVLAIELLTAAQALDFRSPLKPGIGPLAAHTAVRRVIPFATADRAFGEDICSATVLVQDRALIGEVEAAAGSLA